MDIKLADKEERARLKATEEENRRIKYLSAPNSSASYESVLENSASSSDENMDSQDDLQTTTESIQPETGTSAMVTKRSNYTKISSCIRQVSAEYERLCVNFSSDYRGTWT